MKTIRFVENSKYELKGFENVFDIRRKSVDSIKKKFLEARIFDGKSFWQIENEIVWLGEGFEITESTKHLQSDCHILIHRLYNGGNIVLIIRIMIR